MTVKSQNGSIPAGDDKTLIFKIKNAAELNVATLQGDWSLFTGATQGATPILQKTSTGENAPVTFAMLDGVLSMLVKLTTADTVGLTPGSYYHEARVTDAGEELRQTISCGTIEIERTLIRP